MTNDVQDKSAILASCRKLELSDPEFAAWLADYIANYSKGSLGTGKEHEYWAVPLKIVLAHGELAPQRNCAYLSQCFNNEAVLSIPPVPHPLAVKAKAVLAPVLATVVGIAMILMDPIFKWGKKTCPQCFSRELAPFKFESEHEHPHYFCNGCNTIYPPRAMANAIAAHPAS